MSDEDLGLLTFREAAAWLGWGNSRAAGLRLKRRVIAKEKALKRALIVRIEGPERESRRVTRSMLRTHMREVLPSKVDELKRDFGRHLATLDERIRMASSAFVAQQVEPRLSELWQRDEQIAESVNALGARIALLTGTPMHTEARSEGRRGRGLPSRGNG